MKKRNVEGTHAFAQFVADQCNIFALGGLLLDRNWNFTAAVEAFELEKEEKRSHLTSLLNSNGLTKAIIMDGAFAHQLGIPFFVVTHVIDESHIHVYELCSDYKNNELQCVDKKALSEEEFIQWWQEMKGTVQTKLYGKDFRTRAAKSYFDNLLESHGLKWGGNIDGYLVIDRNDRHNIIAIIENRFTNMTPLSKYDPNTYYKGYNGGDYYTWLPLMNLKDSLDVPLFLMTYSYRDGEQNQVGITRVLGQSKNNGLLYIQNQNGESIRPCDNIFQDLHEIKEWIVRNTD